MAPRNDAVAALASDEHWNHNNHYHRLIPRVAPPPYGRVLDVGCGEGLLTRRLAPLAESVVGIDACAAMIAMATTFAGPDGPRYVCGNVLKTSLEGPFDLVTCFATLHHMDLDAGLQRLRELTAPGGTVVVVGLARPATLGQWALSAAGVPAAWVARRRHGEWHHGAPVADPAETLTDVRRAAARYLPGARMRQRLYWRYSLVWRAPAADGSVSPGR